MANYENIKDKGFDKRTTNELREISSKGGKKSGETRRRKANFRKTLNKLLTAEIDNEEWKPVLEALGVECTLETAMLAAQIKAAMNGDTKAAYFVAQYAGQSGQTKADDEEQRIRTDRARRARDQEVGDTDDKNENIRNFLKAMNPDVCGWLTLDHTKIDYPVVQGTDNFEYLEKDVLGNPSVAGSIFLDAKSDRNFHDFYTVIMGHHMQGRKMFGDIDLYTDVSFFEKNTTGTLYVEGRILKLETVAILKADAYDKYVYRTDWKEKEEKEELIRHIYELAVHTRGQRLTVEDQMIALSTCSSGNTNGRHLLICKVIKENTVEGSETE